MKRLVEKRKEELTRQENNNEFATLYPAHSETV